MKKVIIFGTGHDGTEAYNFFSSDYIYCYADNDPAKVNTQIEGKEIISPEELDQYKGKYDIVIAISKNRWMMFSVACQLRRIGIEDFSVYADIKKHYATGLEFIHRDRDLYPYEQESISEIYQYQLDYMVRHTGKSRAGYYRTQLDTLIQDTDASMLTAATGEMRRMQLWGVELLSEFLLRVKQDMGIVCALADGTLLGAVRHGGYIPWDDDVDVSVLYEDFVRLLSYFQSADDMDFFSLSLVNGEEVWQNREGINYRDSIKRYLVAYSYGYMTVFLNIKAPYMRQNVSICDIFPLRYLPYEMTVQEYMEEVNRWIELLKKNIDAPDRVYRTMEQQAELYCCKSNRIGYGFDFVSYISYWNTLQGRGKFERKIWNLSDYLPYTEIIFEGHVFAAPHNYEKWLTDEYGKDYKKIPQRVGLCIHDKDRIFRERY